MRVHVISDMEGVGGIVKSQQTNAGKAMFEEGRKLYTGEINAAVRGAKAAGATEIVVMDCHGAGEGFTFNSLIAEDLDPACEFVVQEEWTGYTEFLEEGCDAALFVGHARDGRHARRRPQPHGLRDGLAEPLVQRDTCRRDGNQRGALRELGLPGPARHGRRSGLPRGKGAARRRADSRVRQAGARRRSARMLVPSRARELIEEGAKKALADLKAVPPYDPGKPCEVKVEYKSTGSPQKLRYQHGVEIIDDRTIVSRADDWWSAWKQFFFIE